MGVPARIQNRTEHKYKWKSATSILHLSSYLLYQVHLDTEIGLADSSMHIFTHDVSTIRIEFDKVAF